MVSDKQHAQDGEKIWIFFSIKAASVERPALWFRSSDSLAMGAWPRDLLDSRGRSAMYQRLVEALLLVWTGLTSIDQSTGEERVRWRVKGGEQGVGSGGAGSREHR